MPDKYVFHGVHPYAEKAIADMQAPYHIPPGEVAGLKPLSRLGDLVGQAFHGNAAHAPAIVAEAKRHAALLYAALAAAEAVLADADAELAKLSPPAAEGFSRVEIGGTTQPVELSVADGSLVPAPETPADPPAAEAAPPKAGPNKEA